MLTAIALTPSAPVLVPELAGAAAAEVADIRDAALAAAGVLPESWVAIGVGPGELLLSGVCGTFAGYGADVPVSLGPEPLGPVAEMPLCALFAGWLRGQVNPAASVAVRVHSADLGAGDAVARGRMLRELLDDMAEPVGVLVVADGLNTLTQAAPGGYDPAAEAVQGALDDALAAGATDALTRLPDAVIGRVAYQVLAGLAPAPSAATELVRGAPYGVGYFVGTWEP